MHKTLGIPNKHSLEPYILNLFIHVNELRQVKFINIRFYNHDRYQKRLNSLSPMEYRAEAA